MHAVKTEWSYVQRQDSSRPMPAILALKETRQSWSGKVGLLYPPIKSVGTDEMTSNESVSQITLNVSFSVVLFE